MQRPMCHIRVMTLDLARCIFATFTPDLRAVMKTAAQKRGWTTEDWVLHIDLTQTSMLDGVCSENLIFVYQRTIDD